jgi:hypothetical protein
VTPGAVFAPFHYGRWEPADSVPGAADDAATEHGVNRWPRAANELTMTAWDPVSKQPYFKTAACRVVRLGAGDAPEVTAQSGTRDPGQAPADVRSTTSWVLDEPPTYPLDPARKGP